MPNFKQPEFTTQTGSAYKAAIDVSIASLASTQQHLLVRRWTARAAAEANEWRAVIWMPFNNASTERGLFVAIASTGTNRSMTSPDGETWTARAAAEANEWRALAYSPAMGVNGGLVAVASTGTNRVMTTTNGTSWTARAAAEANSWRSVAYAPSLGRFAAVASDGTNRVMTSPDGITWTPRAAANAHPWQSIVWAVGISKFVAVANGGSLNQVMTSANGTNWTAASVPEGTASLEAVGYAADIGLVVAVGSSGNNRVFSSPTAGNAGTWRNRLAAELNTWTSICWSPEYARFVAVSSDGTNRVMHSL